MTSFRPAALAVVALLLAACSADAPTAIPAVDAPLLAKTPTPDPWRLDLSSATGSENPTALHPPRWAGAGSLV
ncbi:MAG: hypothetical protein IPN47_19350 [Gemmatimonadetes bacterium]|nr:hypothetical protein [Gemmatimonadota bacterium]